MVRTSNAAPLKRLQKQLTGVVLTDDSARFKASIDNARISFLPEAVIKPANNQDIALILEAANRWHIPITPRGAGSAATGAATPLQGGWVLDLSDWTELSLDKAMGVAYVQPGVVTADLQCLVERKGWFYPPDPSSHQYCTLGGNIACNAGGLRAAKYGVTRDYVLGLEGFLPTGEFVRWGADLKKFASGYNMRDLWIGSEGTLGIVTKAVLKLIPKPPMAWNALIAFPTEIKALQAIKRLLTQGVVPAILEFLDRQTVACVEAYLERSLFKKVRNTPALVLLQLDGHPQEVKAARQIVLPWARLYGAAHSTGSTPEKAEELWAARRCCSQAMYQLAPTKLNEDIVVPLRSYIPLIKYTQALKKKYGLATPIFGHAADGNFHVHIMYDQERAEDRQKAKEGIIALMKRVVALGGVITGEHGIGLTKTEFFRLQHSEVEIAAMRAIKQTLDPNGILNPGKIFEPFPIWRHRPVQVRMPWDK